MQDLGFDRETSPATFGRGLKLFGAAALALMAAAILLPNAYSGRRYTCAACRIERVNHRFLAHHWDTLRETECSRWYAANVEPAHAHSWSAYGQCRRIGIPFLYSGFACSMGGRINMFFSACQIEVYEHSRDRMEAKGLFLKCSELDPEGGTVMASLLSWIASDYQGEWKEWLDKAKNAQP